MNFHLPRYYLASLFLLQYLHNPSIIAIFTYICMGVGYISKSQKGPPQPKHRTDGQKTHALTSGIDLNHMKDVRKQTRYQPSAHNLPT